MKKLYSRIFVLFLISYVLFLISCKDILTEKPKSIAAENFYNTSAEVETAVNAIYSPIRGGNCFGNLYTLELDTYRDYITGRGSFAILSNFQGLDATNITRVESMWTDFYVGIRNANIVITNAPKGSNISEPDIAKYVGEAKFLRAFIYFQIVRNWNKAVLRSESNMTEQNVPLSSADDVYALIVEDLKYAEENLPDVPKISGRPSKWSAKTVLADVYFFQGQYENAMNKAKEVIDSKKYALVEISTYEDFQKIFGVNVITTTEEIFYLKFSDKTGQGNSTVQFFHHPTDPYYNKQGLFANYIADSTKCLFYKNQDNADLRKKLWYNWNIGFGPTTLLSRKFIAPQFTAACGVDHPAYRYGDLLLIYAEAVCRVNNIPNADAMEKLNMIHRRAYGKNSLSPSNVDFKLADYSNSQSFLDLVLKERGYETVDETKRWLDLKRLGRVKELIKAETGIVVADKMLLWPIPTGEFSSNNALDPTKDQNPGY